MKRAPRLSLNPLIILIIFLGASAVGDALTNRLESRRQLLGSARQAFLTTMTATRTQLSALASGVAHDHTLTQNLNWNLEHSVTAALYGKLSKGDMDQVWLVDSLCHNLGQAQLEHAWPLVCPFEKDGAPPKHSSGLFWRNAGGHPALSVVTPLLGAGASGDGAAGDGTPETRRYVVGLVVLDENWLALAPTLGAIMQAGQLSLGPDDKTRTPVWRDGVTKDGNAFAVLASKHFFDRYLVPTLSRKAPLANPLFWPLVVFGLLLASFCLARERRQAFNVQRLAVGAVERCRELTTARAKSSLAEDLDAPPVGPLSAALPRAAEAFVLGAMRDRNKQIDVAAQHIEELTAGIAERNSTIQALAARLAESAELDTLAMQMARTADGFLNKANDLADGAETLTDVLGGPVAEQSKLLFNVLMEWQEGINGRGARKFIRGLSETVGTRPGTTLLDEQVIALATMSGEISDLAVHASIKSHALVETASSLARIAALWRGLAGQYDSDTAPADPAGRVRAFRTALDGACALLRLDRRHQRLTFSDKIDAPGASVASPQEWPAVPAPVWTTALYHVFLSLADRSPSSASITLGIRLRSDHDRSMLIAQAGEISAVPGKIVEIEGTQIGPKPGERAAYHMEIARAVLSPYVLSVNYLPSVDGAFPIAIGWAKADRALPSSAALLALEQGDAKPNNGAIKKSPAGAARDSIELS